LGIHEMNGHSGEPRESLSGEGACGGGEMDMTQPFVGAGNRTEKTLNSATRKGKEFEVDSDSFAFKGEGSTEDFDFRRGLEN